MNTSLNYGNWIRKKNLLLLSAITLVLGALSFIPLGNLYRIGMLILFFASLLTLLVPLYAYEMFSQNGGKIQEKVYDLIIQRLGAEVKGRILDIGSGNGVLAVTLAQRHSAADVVGIDYWGKDWDYSRSVCEQNARAAHVEAQVHFQKGDAAALDFPPNTFDGAVSNLTFHEVKSAEDKRAVVQEALRVVKPGGVFAFVDYFYDEKFYGKAADFEGYLRSLKLTQFEVKPLVDVMALPGLMRHPRIMGKVGIIWGKK